MLKRYNSKTRDHKVQNYRRSTGPQNIKPFRFLNFWTKHETFKALIQENWNAEYCGNPFIVFQHKLKKKIQVLQKGKVYIKCKQNSAKISTFGGKTVETQEHKVFHAYVNGRRKKLRLTDIQCRRGQTDIKEIADEAISFFQKQLTEQHMSEDFNLLKHITNLIDEEKHIKLTELTTKDEIKMAVFELSGESCSGPDGFTGKLYQTG
ncbi:hypothetical protein H5410_003714 [Solanum commersonii]|uniref:Uncharacterized protein n=1 Tax=Solanum commersonii TaxID=4109 RepID=A0A9J6B5E7_SOLCO|nr:hypothetical protein H5410_003714 [Solanum commersonii]